VNSGAGNYQLLGSSLLHNAGTDGADIGVNVSQLNAAQSGTAVQPAAGPTPTPTPSPSTATGRFEQDNAAVQYAGTWYPNNGAFNSGGSASIAMAQDSQAKFTFTGTGVQWIGYRDPWSGIAKVYLDGVLKGTIDTYSATSQGQIALYSVGGLSNASHDLTVVPTGTHNPASAGAWVWVDAFDVTAGNAAATPQPQPPTGSAPPTTVRIKQNDPAVAYTGAWFTNNSSSGSGEATVLSMDASARATLTFTGTAVNWVGYRDEWSGIARIYMDGVMLATVDTYAPAAQERAVLYNRAGLASGVHTLTIEVTGTHNAGSGGSWVWLDAFDVTR
jgi:hypothetical protein